MWEVQRDARDAGMRGCGCPRLDRSRKSREGLTGVIQAGSGKLSPKRALRMRGQCCRCGGAMRDGKDDGDDDDGMGSGGGLGPMSRARKT